MCTTPAATSLSPKRIQGLPDGCPMKGPDTDRDGISDIYDRCPEQPEDFQTVDPKDLSANVAERLDGCPLPTATVARAGPTVDLTLYPEPAPTPASGDGPVDPTGPGSCEGGVMQAEGDGKPPAPGTWWTFSFSCGVGAWLRFKGPMDAPLPPELVVAAAGRLTWDSTAHMVWFDVRDGAGGLRRVAPMPPVAPPASSPAASIPTPPSASCARPSGAADVALTVLHSRSGTATVWIVGPDCTEVAAGVLRAKMETVLVPTWVGQRVVVREGEAPGGVPLHRFPVLPQDVPARKIPSGAFPASGTGCHGVLLEHTERGEVLFRCDGRESTVELSLSMFEFSPRTWPAIGTTGTIEFDSYTGTWTRFTTDAGAVVVPSRPLK
jgi:hypothetical protein